MEFALVLPVLLTIVFGTIEMGRLAVSRAMLAYSTMLGGRTAAVTGTASVAAVQSAVIAATPLLGLTNSNVTVSVSGGKAFTSRATGDTVTVTVSYQFTPAVGFPTMLTSKTLTETNTTRVE